MFDYQLYPVSEFSVNYSYGLIWLSHDIGKHGKHGGDCSVMLKHELYTRRNGTPSYSVECVARKLHETFQPAATYNNDDDEARFNETLIYPQYKSGYPFLYRAACSTRERQITAAITGANRAPFFSGHQWRRHTR